MNGLYLHSYCQYYPSPDWDGIVWLFDAWERQIIFRPTLRVLANAR